MGLHAPLRCELPLEDDHDLFDAPPAIGGLGRWLMREVLAEVGSGDDAHDRVAQ